jgi:glutathione S-transferase
MITVHHLETAFATDPLVAGELGLARDRPVPARPQDLLAPTSLRAIHPLGKAPVLVDGENTFAESAPSSNRGSIWRGHPQTDQIPPRDFATPTVCYAEGSAMPPLLLNLVFSRMRSAPMPFFVKPVAKALAGKVLSQFVEPQLRQHRDYLEGEMSRHAWFAGEAFSAADIQMSFPIEAMKARGVIDAGQPRLIDWLARIHARPAYQRALERGGPFDVLR